MAFSPKTLDFLFENRLNNSRDWFCERKQEYESLVLEPLKELVKELSPGMLQIDARFIVEPRVDKTICRIRRDTRFSHDKSLYRDNMWVIFKRSQMHGTEVPGFYFELSPAGFNYGCGFYQASTSYMNTLRSLILKNDPAFRKAKTAFESQTLYHMEGDCYKRPHFRDQPALLQQWLERRNLCFVAESKDFNLLFSDHLGQTLSKDFQRLAPVYQFLLKTSILEQESELKQENQSAGIRM